MKIHLKWLPVGETCEIQIKKIFKFKKIQNRPYSRNDAKRNVLITNSDIPGKKVVGCYYSPQACDIASIVIDTGTAWRKREVTPHNSDLNYL